MFTVSMGMIIIEISPNSNINLPYDTGGMVQQHLHHFKKYARIIAKI